MRSTTAHSRKTFPGMKAIYVGLAIVLFVLLSFLMHLGAFALVGAAPLVGILPAWAVVTTLVIGGIAGYVIGQKWWRYIYIENRLPPRWTGAARGV